MSEEALATLRSAITFLGGRAVMVPGAPRWYRDGGIALTELEAELRAEKARAKKLEEALRTVLWLLPSGREGQIGDIARTALSDAHLDGANPS